MNLNRLRDTVANEMNKIKIFDTTNTKSASEKLVHQTPKMYLDKSNQAFCINRKLLELLGCKRLDAGYIIFIEDKKGVLGIAKTDDAKKGMKFFWYKCDTRARLFNTTMVEYIMDKYKLKDLTNSYHIYFKGLPVKINGFNVYQIKTIEPYVGVKRNA